MLVTVGGLMATLLFPQRSAVALAVTATLSAASAVRKGMHARTAASDTDTSTPSSPTTSADDAIVLQWSGVTCLLASKSAGIPRALLSNCSGAARPGRILAIMGPSGSGKTTLLNTLAGRIQKSSSISLHGDIRINDAPISLKPSSLPIAYVTQEDLFFSQLTVRETLDLAVKLRVDRDLSPAQREQFIIDLTRKLGLVDAVDSRIGNEKTRGISGGEKKRLSLAIELISAPKLILCDEPTSGLSSFQAEQVMGTLKSLADLGHTIVCSIHQPSSSIFAMCDDLILLAGGRQIYSGPSDKAQDHFANLGYPPPDNQFNPAEIYLQLISIDYTSEETVKQSQERIDKLVEASPSTTSTSASEKETAVATKSSNSSPTSTLDLTTIRKQGRFSRVGALFLRAWKQITRDKKTNISRFMSSFWSALLFGGIYWRLGRTQRTIQDRLGLLQVCIMNNAMSSLVKTLNVFPSESALVNRERIRNTYNIFEYLSSKLLAELPVGSFFPLLFSSIVYPMTGLSTNPRKMLTFFGINVLESFTAASYGLAIGALVPSTEAALAIGPSSFTVQVVFGGLYITEKSVPAWACWIPKVSIIKHGFEALCCNELRGLPFEKENAYDVENGDQVLQRLSWGDSSVKKSCSRLARCLAFNYLFTYAVLTMKKPRFEKLRAPLEEEAAAQGTDDPVVIEDVTEVVEAGDKDKEPNGTVAEKVGKSTKANGIDSAVKDVAVNGQ